MAQPANDMKKLDAATANPGDESSPPTNNIEPIAIAGSGAPANDIQNTTSAAPGSGHLLANMTKLNGGFLENNKNGEQANAAVVAAADESKASDAAANQYGGKNGGKEYKDKTNIGKDVSANPNNQQKEAPAIVNVEVVEPVRKSQRARIPSSKFSDVASNEKKDSPTRRSKSSAPATQSTPKTAEDLYKQIEKSRDKLFFIAYSHDQDPIIAKNTKTKGGDKVEYQWYLVRVDLSTCQQLEDTENCQKNGKYYVEFYTKSSYDQGILLAGNPLENGIRAAQMKPKPDSDSRYWLEWHEYHFDKSGDMVVGKAKEFLPNSKKAIHRRLMDLSQMKRQEGPSSPGSSGTNNSEGGERLMSEYHPDFNKYTTWADVLDLMDTKTRLVGPFDFDDIKPPPLKEEDLAIFNEDTKKLFSANHSNLYVKDRVPLSRWKELLESIKGREIDPPVVVMEETRKKKKKKRLSGGGKRARDESQGHAATQVSSDKRAREEQPRGAVCEECGKGATEKEPLLLFPATSSQSALHVHASCGKRNHNQPIVSKEQMKVEISSMVEAAFTQTRQATSWDGKAYCVLGEVKDALNQALESWVGGMEARASLPAGGVGKLASAMAISSEPLEGLPEANFAEEELASFPVAFAYHNEDPGGISEENAKIATLDYEVEQRRLKRSSVGQSENKKKEKSTSGAASSKTTLRKRSKSSPRKGHPTVGENDLHIATEPAEGFPAGWVIRKVPRSTKGAKADDTYYYSPILQYKFRSKPEVRRFLEALNISGGDEAVAIEKFKR